MKGLSCSDRANLLNFLALTGQKLEIVDEAALDDLVEAGRVKVSRCPDHVHVDVTQGGLYALRLARHYPDAML